MSPAVAVGLPAHIEPMLLRIGAPFDSALHQFEIKWDGVRAVAYVEGGAWRLHGRRRRDLATRYPELAFLPRLSSLSGSGDGFVLDGELVVLRPDGSPDFRAVLGRENAGPSSVPSLARRSPVVYVVFDLLYQDGRSLLAAPLAERRERLQRFVAQAAQPRLVLSDAIVGDGKALFAAACARGLEGIVAKRLDSRYEAGERSGAWQKIKQSHRVHCLVLGYEPSGARDFKSLIVATDVDGELRCVGKVGSGIDGAEREQLLRLLAARPAAQPLVPTELEGRWVEPGIYGLVSYLERTEHGNLRAPVWISLVREDP